MYILTVPTKYYHENETYNYCITFQVYKNQFNNMRAHTHTELYKTLLNILKKTNAQTANHLKIEIINLEEDKKQ